ncbi:hypothetical protein T4E_4029, partial [Trichinella pseudospiralis]
LSLYDYTSPSKASAVSKKGILRNSVWFELYQRMKSEVTLLANLRRKRIEVFVCLCVCPRSLFLLNVLELSEQIKAYQHHHTAICPCPLVGTALKQ